MYLQQVFLDLIKHRRLSFNYLIIMNIMNMLVILNNFKNTLLSFVFQRKRWKNSIKIYIFFYLELQFSELHVHVIDIPLPLKTISK